MFWIGIAVGVTIMFIIGVLIVSFISATLKCCFGTLEKFVEVCDAIYIAKHYKNSELMVNRYDQILKTVKFEN